MPAATRRSRPPAHPAECPRPSNPPIGSPATLAPPNQVTPTLRRDCRAAKEPVAADGPAAGAGRGRLDRPAGLAIVAVLPARPERRWCGGVAQLVRAGDS